MGETTKFAVLGTVQVVLIALALIAALFAAYWLAAALNTGSLAAIGLNLYDNLEAPYDAPKFLFASLFFTTALLFGLALCGVWAQGPNRMPMANAEPDDELPIDLNFMPRRDRARYMNTAPTLLDIASVQRHRRR